MKQTIYFNCFYVIMMIISSCNDSNNQEKVIPEIHSKKAIKLFNNENYLFLDVRTYEEHQKLSIPNTMVIPIQDLASTIDELQHYKDKEIIVYCRSGNRSKKGTQILIKNGFKAHNMIGGMKEWNGPIEKSN